MTAPLLPNILADLGLYISREVHSMEELVEIGKRLSNMYDIKKKELSRSNKRDLKVGDEVEFTSRGVLHHGKIFKIAITKAHVQTTRLGLCSVPFTMLKKRVA